MLYFLEDLQTFLFIFFALAYAYQIVYLLIGLFGKCKEGKQDAQLKRYAVLISARNEENVIAELIGSLKNQEYPKELLDIYVIADNCTDSTAKVSEQAGAIVYERFNKNQVGKGYAMDTLISHIFQDKGKEYYEGFFVFDADNYVDKHFVAEMNKMFAADKYAAITCYRNSKNFCENWISAGYALWFLRESRFLNQPRAAVGASCAVSGTGFLIAADVLREEDGWHYHLLTEDIEFSICCATKGRKIGYCKTAVIYDEQPTEFKQSWDQRLRWSKGFYQVNAKYTGSLLRGIRKPGKKGFACYDMFMTVAPSTLITILSFVFSFVVGIIMLYQPAYVAYRAFRIIRGILWAAVRGISFSLFLYGLATMITEWKNIDGPTHKKVLYVFTFPFFMLTYVPISLAALVQKVEWRPIKHGTTTMKKEERI